VAYTDIDEILVADPRSFLNLVELASSTEQAITTAFGMHIVPGNGQTPGLIPTMPILRQRPWVLGVGSMSKPTLIKIPVRWGPGFHYANSETQFGDLFLFHLAYSDIATVRRRQQKRLSVQIVSNHGSHHGAAEDEFILHLESWSNLPRVETADLGRHCSIRANFTAQLFETRRAGNGLRQLDATVSAGAIWRIPERLLGVV